MKTNNTQQIHGTSTNQEVSAFSFGDPVPVLDRAEILNYFESVLMHSKYYEPPINPSYLAKALNASTHHQSAIKVKANILLSTCVTDRILPRSQLERFIMDFLIFGNGYLEAVKNTFGKIVQLKAPLGKYMRRGTEVGQYYQVVNGFDEFEFEPFSICHVVQPDVNQEIYGLPDYLAALQSAFLNESATLFRRKYYLNGAHAGSIIYMTDPTNSKDDIDEIKRQLKETKGKGNFKNLFVYIPNGKKDGMQILPLSDIVAKDEFANIKNASRDDVLASHRVPPQLMGIVPTNTGGFGDVEKAAKVFFINEIKPLQEKLKEINEWVGQDVIKFTGYALLELDDSSKK
ncbi:phage portal protein [Actinobacillus equuli]|uniref:Phage portal protein, PBSX family n=1 Tax=Actinobacillus equuli TaxID=718 RepID=A0AAX3FLG1_ACTEU|nr:phage portal protein [Actinobacillus equuli]AIZ78792.1 portal vertex protein [Actinobacillus equuli subsp. equuli]WGE45052.1 phage portal protein [Actinobacillus equuli subsp. equuli]VEE93018.1 phage portal protein, PBSX family [Actinobacillus equuli]